MLVTLFLANEDAANDNINAVADFYLNHILCGKDIIPPAYYSFLETFLYPWLYQYVHLKNILIKAVCSDLLTKQST